MRTFRRVVMSVATLSLILPAPAGAATFWECMGPSVACSGASSGASSARSYRQQGRPSAQRSSRRHAQGQRVRRKVAHAAPRRDRAAAARPQMPRAAKAMLPKRVATTAKNRSGGRHLFRAVTTAPQTRPDLPAILSSRAATPRVAAAEMPDKPVQNDAPAASRTVAAPSSTGVAPAKEPDGIVVVRTQTGLASYYGTESGSQTASGARFNPDDMTAAHRTLPFGTKVRVTNERNGRSVVVTINDRGPFIPGRIIDLSTGAAGVIGMRAAGIAPVRVEVLAHS